MQAALQIGRQNCRTGTDLKLTENLLSVRELEGKLFRLSITCAETGERKNGRQNKSKPLFHL